VKPDRIAWHTGPVFSAPLSPDVKFVVTASGDNTARVWEAASGEEVARMAHWDWVEAVAFSPDGQWLATGSDDGTARVWEAASGQEVARMAHEDMVFAVAFSPDGQWLATASGDNMARVWLVWPDDLIAESCARLTRNLTLEEWKRYLGDEPYRKTCPALPVPGE
jgi:WD40 repeat protein